MVEGVSATEFWGTTPPSRYQRRVVQIGRSLPLPPRPTYTAPRLDMRRCDCGGVPTALDQTRVWLGCGAANALVQKYIFPGLSALWVVSWVLSSPNSEILV
jgi:hypothetical protein